MSAKAKRRHYVLIGPPKILLLRVCNTFLNISRVCNMVPTVNQPEKAISGVKMDLA